MKIFAKKSPADRRAETAKRLAEAEAQAKATQDERLRLALVGESTDAAEEAAWKAEARIRTLKDALAAFDAEIAQAEVEEAARKRKQRRDEAAEVVRGWKANAVELRAKLLPLIREVHVLAIRHDHTGAGLANRLFAPFVGNANSALYVGAESQTTFDIMLQRLERDDDEAASLANRVLSFKMPAIAPIE